MPHQWVSLVDHLVMTQHIPLTINYTLSYLSTDWLEPLIFVKKCKKKIHTQKNKNEGLDGGRGGGGGTGSGIHNSLKI